ncbi:MAG: two-component system sensor histidine kinase EvgS, partial [Candidatus Paceibacteria bacterium]
LNSAHALRAFGGDDHKLTTLLQQFMLSSNDDVLQAGRLLRDGDTAATAALAHGLSGSARLLGAEQLAQVASAIEVVLLDGDTETGNVLFEELKATLQLLQQVVAQRAQAPRDDTTVT